MPGKGRTANVSPVFHHDPAPRERTVFSGAGSHGCSPRDGPCVLSDTSSLHPHAGHDSSFPATATATKLSKVPSERTGCQSPPLCPAQPPHRECDPEDAWRVDTGPRGGRISNRSLSTALGLCVCCWGETEELLVPKHLPSPVPSGCPDPHLLPARERLPETRPAVGGRQRSFRKQSSRERPKWGGPSGITYVNGGFWGTGKTGVKVTQASGLEPGSPGTPQCSWKARCSWKNREALGTGRRVHPRSSRRR